MKSLEARFKEIDENPKHDGQASIIKFFYAVNGKRYARKIIQKWFNKLVDKNDYDRADKAESVAYAMKITLPQD